MQTYTYNPCDGDIALTRKANRDLLLAVIRDRQAMLVLLAPGEALHALDHNATMRLAVRSL